MKVTADRCVSSRVYERVLASAGAALPLSAGAIDGARLIHAVRQYCESFFLPEPVDGVIAGGFVRDWVLNVKPNDLDFYATRDQCARLTKRLRVAGWCRHDAHRVLSTWRKGDKTVQLIEFGGNAAECIRRFDLTVCCAALDLRRQHVICAEAFLPDLAAKHLVIHEPARAVDTMRRVARFVTQGFTISRAELRLLERCVKAEGHAVRRRGSPVVL